jgi:hypothetical protein
VEEILGSRSTGDPGLNVGVGLQIDSPAAWMCHWEDEIGSIRPGKLADLVVQTWMDGKQVYES